MEYPSISQNERPYLPPFQVNPLLTDRQRPSPGKQTESHFALACCRLDIPKCPWGYILEIFAMQSHQELTGNNRGTLLQMPKHVYVLFLEVTWLIVTLLIFLKNLKHGDRSLLRERTEYPSTFTNILRVCICHCVTC